MVNYVTKWMPFHPMIYEGCQVKYEARMKRRMPIKPVLKSKKES